MSPHQNAQRYVLNRQEIAASSVDCNRKQGSHVTSALVAPPLTVHWTAKMARLGARIWGIKGWAGSGDVTDFGLQPTAVRSPSLPYNGLWKQHETQPCSRNFCSIRGESHLHNTEMLATEKVCQKNGGEKQWTDIDRRSEKETALSAVHIFRTDNSSDALWLQHGCKSTFQRRFNLNRQHDWYSQSIAAIHSRECLWLLQAD